MGRPNSADSPVGAHHHMNIITSPATIPNLGSQPEDPLIVDLVQLNPVSVRVRNAICGAARNGRLPIQRVSEYLSLGENRGEALMLRVPNIGTKSLVELKELIARAKDLVPRSGVVHGVSDDMKEVRLSLCDCFPEETVLEGLRQVLLPIRLVRALQQTGVGGELLSTATREFDEMSLRLRRHPSVGSKTIKAWRDSIGDVIHSFMLARGLVAEDAQAATSLILEGSIAELPRLQSLAKAVPSMREAKSRQYAGANPESFAQTSAPWNVEDMGTTVDVCVKEGLRSLDERTRRVIHQRRGLSGRRQTLEQIGQALGVTRERVRQIEAKGLRLLRRVIGTRLPEVMRLSEDEQWSDLVADADYLLAGSDEGRKDKLSPWFLLALDLRGITIPEWLDEFARRVDGGWISPRWQVEKFEAIRRQFRVRLAATCLPCALSEVLKGQPSKMAMAAVAFGGFQTYGTYVVGSGRRLTPRLRRAIRLHETLGRVGRCTPVVDLARAYVAARPKDRCSTRDCEIVMREHKHLFLEVLEGSWAALGPVGDVPEDDAQASVEGELEAQPGRYELGASESQSGAWTTIAEELDKTGPASLGVLMRRAHEFLPAGRSVGSVGVVMSQRKDVFCRILPGVYALHHQVPSGNGLLATPPTYVLQEDQARLYALARWAGEPWGAYPLWIPETEYLLCAWAQQQGKAELLDNLLAVAQIDHWPDQIDRERWDELAATSGGFSLHFPMRTEALAAPGLDQVFAACLYIRDHGHFSWISANRVLKRRVWEYWSAGLLAVLVAIEALTDEVPDWQKPHLPGPRVDELIAQMEAVRRKKRELNWDSDIGRTLVECAVSASVHRGWVTTGVVQKVLRNLMEAPPARASSPLDELLSERAKAKDVDAREQLLRSLSGSSNGTRDSG